VSNFLISHIGSLCPSPRKCEYNSGSFVASKSKRYLFLAALIVSQVAISGCTEMQDFYGGTHLVTVDGTKIMVRQLPNRPTGYHAVINKPRTDTLFTRDPGLSVLNIRAIEKHTGCSVAPTSIENREMHTFASVSC
jgi:hypothetical protein